MLTSTSLVKLKNNYVQLKHYNLQEKQRGWHNFKWVQHQGHNYLVFAKDFCLVCIAAVVACRLAQMKSAWSVSMGQTVAESESIVSAGLEKPFFYLLLFLVLCSAPAVVLLHFTSLFCGNIHVCSPGCSSMSRGADYISSKSDIWFCACDLVCGVARVTTQVFEVLQLSH